MRRPTSVAAFATVLLGAVLAMPAAAQFGSIFGGDQTPRPPSGIPDQENLPPPGGNPRQGNYPPQQGNYPPQGNYPVQGNTPVTTYPPQGNSQTGIQQRQLPPPTGQSTATTEPPTRAPVQRQQRGPQPSDTSPQPGDEVIAEPPSQKIANNSALFSGLDKITGRIINFDVAVGETVQFGALQLTPRACYTRPPTEPPNTDSFIEVDEVTLQGDVRRIFTGWMFAASPGLHAVEHPIYDIWLTDCKNPVATAEQKPAVAEQQPATPTRTQPRPQPKRQPVTQQQPGYPPYR